MSEENGAVAQAAEVQPVAQVENAVEQQDSQQGTEIQDTQQKQEPSELEKAQKAFEKRIGRMTREKYQDRARIEELQRRLESIEKRSAATQQPQGEPRPEQFDSWDKYIDARTDFVAKQKIGEELKQRDAQYQAHQQAMNRAQAEQKLQSSLHKAIDAYPDLIETISDSDAPTTPAMEEGIKSLGDKAPDVMYYLAKNPDVAEEIAGLNPVMAIMRIAEIAKDVQRPTKQVSKAPPPINPVGGSAKTAPRSLAECKTQEDFEARRLKYIQTHRR